MLFSEVYQITRTEEDGWFDPILHQDTKLFIDPFLIFKNEFSFFSGAHTFMMNFFNKVFELIAKSRGNAEDINYKKAVQLLRFHEVNEICLGYSPTRDGAGPGKIAARTMAKNIWNCIKKGIISIKHFEELGIFSVGIGADSISDITANLLKDRLVKYTQVICEERDIPLQNVRLRNAVLDFKYLRWENNNVRLPVNNFKDKGVLLVPKCYLRELPEINKDDFWDSVCENEILRNDINFEIDRNIDKATIAKFARENPHFVREYVNEVEGRQGTPYDLQQDYKLRYKWYEKAKKIVRDNPLRLLPVHSEIEFKKCIRTIAQTFKDYIENQSGYKLLWDDNYSRNKSEEAAQLLFKGIVEHYCKANDIDISREVNQGRGPVDFKFSSGYNKKVLLEIKLAKNTKFWQGINVQLPMYLTAEVARHGIFLVIMYRKADYERTKGIQSAINRINLKNGLDIELVIVDATPMKQSASKLTRLPDLL